MSWIPVFIPWGPAGLWMWAALPPRKTRPRAKSIYPPAVDAEPAAPLQIAETLKKFSYGLLEFGLSGDQVDLIRMISMESQRYPELARRYYESGPKRGEEALARYCAEQIELGRLRFVLGFDTDALAEAAVGEHVNEAVQTWLAAYGVL